jgi:hypothetical protein
VSGVPAHMAQGSSDVTTVSSPGEGR